MLQRKNSLSEECHEIFAPYQNSRWKNSNPHGVKGFQFRRVKPSRSIEFDSWAVAVRKKKDQKHWSCQWLQAWISKDDNDYRRTCRDLRWKYLVYLWKQLRSCAIKSKLPIDCGKNQILICVYWVHHRAECPKHIEEIQKTQDPGIQWKLYHVTVTDSEIRKFTKFKKLVDLTQR